MARSDSPRLAILGAGPIGLEAALYAQKLQWNYTVYERGRIAEHVRRWGHVRLFSPFGMNTTALGKTTVRTRKPGSEFPTDDALQTGAEFADSYLMPIADFLKDRIRGECQVLRVGRKEGLKTERVSEALRSKNPFVLLVREKNHDRIEEADVVFDCTGTFGQHRWLGDGGIPALGEIQAESSISYGLDDILGERKKDYLGRCVLVVGSGYSAATTASNLAKLSAENSSTWAIWLSRHPHSTPIKRISNDPYKERDRLAVRANNLATRSDDNVEFHAGWIVETLESHGPDKGYKVTARQGSKKRTWDVDKIVGNVGYTPDTLLFRELQIQECPVTMAPAKMAPFVPASAFDALAMKPIPPDALKNHEPNFFILGAKSFGRSSHFFLRLGHDQIRQAFQILTGKKDLDLFKAA